MKFPSMQFTCVLAAWTIGVAPPLPALAQLDFVERVVDGDTIITKDLGRVRLIGINSPETLAPAQRQGAPAQCYGPEASAKLKELLPPGTRVRLETDVEPTDKYGRTLVYVFREPDDLLINGALVEGGYARARAYKPNVQFEGMFTLLQKDAQAARRGLWGGCDAAIASASAPAPAAAASAISALAAGSSASRAGPIALPSASIGEWPSANPANPGDSKNCADFGSFAEAKRWFDKYSPFYGDVAKLDGDGDGVPCESLLSRERSS